MLRKYHFGEVSKVKKTSYQASSVGSGLKKKKLIIISLILAIVVGHFVFQMSFITGENERFIESMANANSPAGQNAVAKTEAAKNKLPDSQSADSDIVIVAPKDSDSRKNVQTIKAVEKESNRQAEIVPVRNSPKKEVKRDSRAERLRRAEKILTGF